MKITEKANKPGMCHICASPFSVGEVIVCSHLGTVPVAAHAQCDPDFKVGGSAPPEKMALRSERGIKATPTQQLGFLARDVHPLLIAVVGGYDYNPGSSDLDDEQSINVRMTLGDYRRAARLKHEVERM